MKKQNFRSKNLNSRLTAYFATATAALLIVPATKAAIQDITIANLSSPPSTPGVVPQITFTGLTTSPADTSFISFKAGPLKASMGEFLSINKVDLAGQFAATSHGKVNKLASGVNIAGLNFTRNGSQGIHTLKTGPVPGGGVSTNYVGFKTVKNGQTYYGWLRVQLTFGTDGKADMIKLVSKNGSSDIFGAYGSKQAGDNVWAGIVATPEPSVAALGGLALLACGAAGVREMRRRRQTETAKAE